MPALIGKPRAPLFPALFVPVSLAVLLVIYLVRYDLWWNLPDPYVNAAFNLRYRTPLVPLMMLGAAAAVGWPWEDRRWRGLSMALMGVLLLVGLSLRFSQRSDLLNGQNEGLMREKNQSKN